MTITCGNAFSLWLLSMASPVVLTHPQNLEWQKNGTLFDNQNNQSFEMAKNGTSL